MSMTKPSLMHSAIFKIRTTNVLGGAMARNNLKPIDTALGRLDFTPIASTAQKITWLEQLIGACAVWRAAKAHKLVQGTPNYSANTAARAVVVDEVATQAMDLLKYYRFEQAKKHRMGHVPAAPVNRRGLQHGHQNEGLVYDQNKAQGQKTQNFGGGSLVEANMAAYQGNAGAYGNNVPGPVQGVLASGKTFAQLNPGEFKVLADYFGNNNMSMQQPVHYADKTERIRNHMVVVINGLIRKQPDADYSTAVDMWAMDKYGNFLCTAAGAQVAVGNGQFQYNHSSLNAGHDVICAGTVVITNGVIMQIDNNSGHYRPTRINLHSAVNIMHHDLGMTFAPNVVIESHAPPRRRYNSFVQFLADPNAPGVAF